MELKDIQSLYNFGIVLKSVISRTTEKANLKVYNKDFKEAYYGYKFEVDCPNRDKIWLSVGLWFNKENPVITIGAWDKTGWGKPFCDKLREKPTHNSNYAAPHYMQYSTYYFEGTEKFYREFCDATTVDMQKEILCNFVDEVVEFYAN